MIRTIFIHNFPFKIRPKIKFPLIVINESVLVFNKGKSNTFACGEFYFFSNPPTTPKIRIKDNVRFSELL